MTRKAYIPALLGCAMAIGVWLGSGLTNPFDKSSESEQWRKIEQILQYVESDYVDTISKGELEEEIISFLMHRLDPHSHYISKQDLQAVNEPLEGNFEGIGVQFNLQNDSIYVVNTIPGGPSDKAGLRAGDLIVSVDSQIVAGTGLTNKRVMTLLKGPEGSQVEVGVVRSGEIAPKSFKITRGEIPINSIDAAYLINDSTIYVKLVRFAKNTYEEFQDKVYPLHSDQVSGLVLDLRHNGGGYLDAAIHLADEFLSEGRLITYTEGRSRPKMEYLATSEGRFEEMALSLIIDGFSASASEILAGAIQDHDRGVIVGKRSFGKGLVQEQSEWIDGSATRLTVARYYTPNGKSIQRPYETLSSGSDFTGIDSVKGGIEPDLDVERDTSGVTWLYAEIVHRGLLSQFAYAYRDQHLNEFSRMSQTEFIAQVSLDSLAAEMHAYLEKLEIDINEKEWERSKERMMQRCKALIGRNIFGDEIYYRLNNVHDPFVKTAVGAIKKPKRSSSV